MKFFLLFTILLILICHNLAVDEPSDKAVTLAITDKLAPAMLKCFSKKITGIDIDKVTFIISKLAQNPSDLKPTEIIYFIIKTVAHSVNPKKYYDVVVIGAKLFKLTVALSFRPDKFDTASAIETLAESMNKFC
jgi:hypothetical protein